MRRGLRFAGAVIVVGAILGSTVFREQVVQAAAAILNVKVTNTAANPVPVTLTGTPTVQVGSAALPEPYQHNVFFNQQAGVCTLFVCTRAFPAVPEGKRLVITYASARFALVGDMTGAHVAVGLNGNDSTDPQVLLPAPINTGFGGFLAAGPVTLIAEAGDVPTITFGGQHTSDSNTAQVNITGYLVDVP
jgi:hypothetical protein